MVQVEVNGDLGRLRRIYKCRDVEGTISKERLDKGSEGRLNGVSDEGVVMTGPWGLVSARCDSWDGL